MTKWEKEWYLGTTTRDIIKSNPSGDYSPNFISEEELKKYKMPNKGE